MSDAADKQRRKVFSGREWRELLAAAGVILSLIFVGLELRQNTLAVRATALTDITTGARDLLLAVSTDAELADLYRRWTEGDSTLTATERTRIRFVLLAMLRGAENVFLQARIGVIDSVALRGYGLTNNAAFRSPLFAELWGIELRERFHPDFVAVIESHYSLDPPR